MPSAGSVFRSASDLLRQKRTFIVVAVLCCDNTFTGPLGSTDLAGLSLGHLQARDHRDIQPTVFHREAVDDKKVRQRTLGVILGSVAAVSAYGNAKWWQDEITGRFRKVDEGWCGQETYRSGADKLDHFFMDYAATRLSSSAFIRAGNTPESFLKLAAWTTFGILTGVEILDGFSRN